MKAIAALIILLGCLPYASQAQDQKTTPRIEPADNWFRDFGFQKLPEVVRWIRQLDAEWDKLVKNEQRAQVLRQLKQVASVTAELKLHCEKTVSLLQTGGDAIPEIQVLEDTVRQLRERMTSLSTDLGGDIGEDGLQVAKQFQHFMLARSGLYSEARRRLSYNKPEDRTAAADYLTKAAVLAGNAHEVLVVFIKDHEPSK